MTYSDSVVINSEDILYMESTTWWLVVAGAFWSALLFVLFVALGLGPLWFISLWPLGSALFNRWTTEYTVTESRVLYKTGFIWRASNEINLTQMEGLELYQPLLGRILGYGTVLVLGAGQSKVPFLFVQNPIYVQGVIRSAVDSVRTTS
jgi:uncharacterized membrane protein YdbT with pleckstrin-like domain